VFVLVLKHQANRSLLHLGGKFGLPHGSILSSDGASWKAGAVHSSRAGQLNAPHSVWHFDADTPARGVHSIIQADRATTAFSICQSAHARRLNTALASAQQRSNSG
jgi:hypothetical protein